MTAKEMFKKCRRIKLEIKKQTNRQWLESLSDEEFAHLLKSICDGICDECMLNEIFNCQDIESIAKWLQYEHKE